MKMDHARRREQEDDGLQVSHPSLGYANAHHRRDPDSGSLSNVNKFLQILPSLNEPAEYVVSSHRSFRVNDRVTRFTGFEMGWLGYWVWEWSLLAIETRSSPLQMIAQEIFTIFISRIADIPE